MSFGLLVQAETIKLFSRTTARFGILVSFAIGMLLPLLLVGLSDSSVVVNGAEGTTLWGDTGSVAVAWGLYVRNFFVVRAFLVILAAQSLAGELQARTLREIVLRPVPRTSVVLAKWISILIWDAVSLVLTFFISASLGMIAFGFAGDWAAVGSAYIVNFFCDAGVIAVVLALASATRSTVATISGMLVGLVLDKMLGWFLMASVQMAIMFETSPFIVSMIEQWPFLPSAAFGLWSSMLPGGVLDARSVGSLVALTIGGMVIAVVRINRIEFP